MSEENKDMELTQVTNANEIPEDVSKAMDDVINDINYKDSIEVTDSLKVEDAQVDATDDVVEDVADAEPTEVDATDDNKDGFEEIDSRLVSAARRFGWSDDKIIKVAEEDETILEDLASLVEYTLEKNKLQEPQKEVPEDKSEKVEALDKFELSSEELDKLKDSLGEDGTNLVTNLSQRLNTAIDRLNEIHGDVGSVKRAELNREESAKLELANTAFDKASETFPILGKISELPRLPDGQYDRSNPAFQARAELFAVAEQFTKLGKSYNQALDEAINWFAGKTGSKQVEDKVVKSLNARKKQFTAKPTHKKTERQFGSKNEEVENTMSEIFDNLGIEQ
jgi:hypothetical protein